MSNVIVDSASKTVNLPVSSPDVRVTKTEPRRRKRHRIETNFGPDFITAFLVETFDNMDVDVITEELVSMFLIEKDLKTYQEAIRFIDAIFWKEAIKK